MMGICLRSCSCTLAPQPARPSGNKKKIWVRSLSSLEKQRFFCSCWVFMFITLVSYPFSPNTRSMHVIWLAGLKDYRKWKHLFYPRPMLEKLTDQPALQLPASLSSPSNSLQFSIQFRVGNFKTKILYSHETLPLIITEHNEAFKKSSGSYGAKQLNFLRKTPSS